MEIMRQSMIDPSMFRGFEPVITIQITEETTPEIIFAAHEIGIKAAKVYPRDVTTNSHHGVSNYKKIHPALKAATKCGMVVCFHAEHPSEHIQGMEKEQSFIGILEEILGENSRLKMVVEHVSSGTMVFWVKHVARGYRVAATVAPQYLLLSIDDVVGYTSRAKFKGEVHHLCKPVLKLWEDRMAIQDAVLDGHPAFFYGGDDAPHFKVNKEAALASCGIFVTRTALPSILEFFFQNEQTGLIDNFFSGFGARHYGVPKNEGKITFERTPWIMPQEYIVTGISTEPVSAPSVGSVVPMLAGEKMEWTLVS
jgi:dihydroorotase